MKVCQNFYILLKIKRIWNLFILNLLLLPKNYSVVREILKKERGENYKLSKLESLENYLSKENINYEVYQSIKIDQEESIFASYGEVVKDKQREREAQELGNSEEEDVINEEW